MATRDDTIAFLCKLVSLVGTEVYHSQIEHDCFCSETRYLEPARFESVHPEILAYISNAVTNRIKAETKDPVSEAKYSRQDWQYEVVNGDTCLGYADWIEHSRERDSLNEVDPASDGPEVEIIRNLKGVR